MTDSFRKKGRLGNTTGLVSARSILNGRTAESKVADPASVRHISEGVRTQPMNLRLNRYRFGGRSIQKRNPAVFSINLAGTRGALSA
jgi:hypothetical protein